MRKSFSILIISALLLVVLGANYSSAQVSSAAVLFLRIAAGARAAGMGEAFVAVADDATATHWNPAGLGQYPLASTWYSVNIPEKYRPLSAVALLEGDGTDMDYRKYDIWAISQAGLVRYRSDDERWTNHDIISVRRDKDLGSVLREYTGLVGDAADEQIPVLVEKIAPVNNPYPIERLDSLEAAVMPLVPEDYESREDLQNALINAREAFNQCRLNWEILEEAFRQADRATRDSALSEVEADRILFAVEKGTTRFIPGELSIPFGINFRGEPRDIAASDKYLWLASDSGLYRYNINDQTWQDFTGNTGLPPVPIRSIMVYDKRTFLGTDSGLVLYQSGGFTHFGPEQGLPRLPVSAAAADGNKKAWAVVGDDLYFFDGVMWRNFVEYEEYPGVPVESIYENMRIYDNAAEKEAYISKFEMLNPDYQEQPVPVETDSVSDEIERIEGLIDSVGLMRAVDEALEETGIAGQIRDALTAEDEATVKVPLTAGLRFNVYDMEVDNYGNVWIGTEHGLIMFNTTSRSWRAFGYRNYIVQEDISLFDLALNRVNGDSTRAERLVQKLRDYNELHSEMLTAGQSVKIYANPAGSRINDMEFKGNRLYFATSVGTIFYDGLWSRLNERGLDRQNTSLIRQQDNDLWFMTRDRIEISAAGKIAFTMMHVNWLPELADDIYYEFFGYVQNVEGWGTIGGNITFLSYGKIIRTNEAGREIDDFSAFDIAFTLSYGTPLTENLSGGISAKIIYSHLSELGAGKEKGSGTSTGLALDMGLLYRLDPRLSLGMALTNLGPDISYIDVSQADPLPRNMAIGLAWKMIESQYNEILFTIEANKSLAEQDKTILEDGRDVLANPQDELSGLLFNPITLGGLTNHFKGVIINGGIEYTYGSFFAFRAGYIHDEEGAVKTPTLGVGLAYDMFQFDFAYIPSNENIPLANTMRFSLSLGW